MLSDLVIIIGFAVAARVGDRLAKRYPGMFYDDDRPTYLWLIPAVPAIAVRLIAFWTHINERVYREGAASVILEMLLLILVGIGMFYGLIKLGSYRRLDVFPSPLGFFPGNPAAVYCPSAGHVDGV